MARLTAPLLLASLALSATAIAPPGRGPHEGAGAEPSAAVASAPRPLPFFYDLYAFRGDTGTTDVVAAFAVPVGNLDSDREDGQVRYRFNVTLVLADTLLGGVARADDSVFVALPRALASGHLLHTHVETRARPSVTTVHRVVMIDAPNPGTGQLYTDPFVVPDFSGEDLMLSDIAMGLPDRDGGWKRGEATLALLPSSHFPGGVFDVYYEVYNLPRDHRYITELAFEPAPEPGSPAPAADREVRVRFFGESTAGSDEVLRELRRVDASLDRGRYRLTVTVTDQESGRTASRSRVLEVREWEEGATLVPTCPVTPGAVRPGCRTKAVAEGS